MEFLHTNEYKEIVKIFYGELPEMNSFTQFESCKELIRKIPSEELNKLFLMVVKKRKINNKFFDKSNNEFNQICLSLNLDAIQMESLIYQLKANKI